MASAQPAQKAVSRPRGARRMLFLAITAGVLVAGTIASFFYIQDVTVRNQAWLDQRLELKANIDQLTKISREASQGLEPDFRALTARQAPIGCAEPKAFCGSDPTRGDSSPI